MAYGFTHENPIKGASNEWYTPASIFAGLGAEYTEDDRGVLVPTGDLLFTMDTCSPGVDGDGHQLTFVPAPRHLTQEEDGLKTDWGSGMVWCNPPYGKETEVWLDKCAAHGESGGSAVALVFSRTETKWFRRAALSASRVLFLTGRVRFHQGSILSVNNGTPGTGSVMFGWGDEAAELLDNCALDGLLVGGPGVDAGFLVPGAVQEKVAPAGLF